MQLKKTIGGDLLPHVSINIMLLQSVRCWVIYKEQRLVSCSSGCWEAQDWYPQLLGLASSISHCQRVEDHGSANREGEGCRSSCVRIPKQPAHPTLLIRPLAQTCGSSPLELCSSQRVHHSSGLCWRFNCYHMNPGEHLYHCSPCLVTNIISNERIYEGKSALKSTIRLNQPNRHIQNLPSIQQHEKLFSSLKLDIFF